MNARGRVGAGLCGLTLIVFASSSGVAGLSAAATSQSIQQPGTGVVQGLIQFDGGPLPGLTVVLEREATVRKTTTNVSGRYSIVDVPPGTYRINIQLAGFRPVTQEDVVVTAASTTTANVKLRLNNGHSTLAPEGTDTTDAALARAVYEAVLPKIYRNASGDLLVMRTALVPAVLSRDDWNGSFAAVAELRSTLERTADRAPVFLRAESFPPGVKLITAESGRQTTWFTPVFFTADGRLAVVYFENYCGNVCGEGTMVWLTRTDTGGWQIGGSRTFWVS